MMQRLKWTLLLTLLVSACATPAAPSPLSLPPSTPPALTETQKIERLIAAIAGLNDAKFIRKGEAYDVSAAVRFLRGKWDWWRKDIKTAQDFVLLASAGYLGTGEPYYIQFQDGRKIPSRDFLAAELQKLEAPPAATTPRGVSRR